MLVAAGRSCYEVAKVFGDDPRSVERWVRKYQKNGVAGLREKLHTGRHATLDDAQMHQLVLALQSPPRECGHVDSAWSGKLLRAEIQRRFGSSLSARHCQRLFNGMQSSRF